MGEVLVEFGPHLPSEAVRRGLAQIAKGPWCRNQDQVIDLAGHENSEPSLRDQLDEGALGTSHRIAPRLMDMARRVRRLVHAAGPVATKTARVRMLGAEQTASNWLQWLIGLALVERPRAVGNDDRDYRVELRHRIGFCIPHWMGPDIPRHLSGTNIDWRQDSDAKAV